MMQNPMENGTGKCAYALTNKKHGLQVIIVADDMVLAAMDFLNDFNVEPDTVVLLGEVYSIVSYHEKDDEPEIAGSQRLQ
jgi:hypothetical protein